jgi:hypothetical protein
MQFEKGDTVEALDDDFKGKVLKVTDNEILVEDEDGFEIGFLPNQLIKITEDLDYNTYTDVDMYKSEDFSSNKKQSKSHKENQTIVEVDLHIEQLTDKHKRLPNHEILELQLSTAKYKINWAMRNNIQKMIFIHGNGDGVLKLELEYMFNRFERIDHKVADYRKYGLGATEIYIRQAK